MPKLFGRRQANSVNPPPREQQVEISDYNLWQLVGELRNLETAHNYMYAEYDLMAEDTIIGAALQIYADNAIQLDSDTSRILKVDSDSPQLSRDLNTMLRRLNVEDKLWNVAYNTAKYGNKCWRVIATKDGKDIESIEEIDSPESVVDLYLQGNPAVFAYNDDDENLQQTLDYEFYDRNAFVHFLIQSGKVSDTIELRDHRIRDNITGEPALIRYQVRRGESMIEGVRAIYRILRTLEDNLICAIVARGDYTKIVNIEGSNNNEVENRKLVNKVKRLFDSRFAFDTREGQKSAESYKQPRSFNDPIFNVTNNGKGAINIESDGGEIEVKDLAHIDYFNKLKFSGLHITPSMLAFEENIPGGISGSADTMIQQDIRLAMYVKKLTVAITSGIEDLCNIWLTLRGRQEEIGKFHIRMAVPSTAESLAELNELNSRLESISNLSRIITETAPGVNTAAVTKMLFEEYIPNKKLLEKINKLIDEPVKIGDQQSKVAMAEINSTLRQLSDDKVPVDQMEQTDDPDLEIIHPKDNPYIQHSKENNNNIKIDSNITRSVKNGTQSFKSSDYHSESDSTKFI